MNEAIREAKLALAEDEIPIGAIVVCKGKIIGRGHNLTERLSDVSAHAEMQAAHPVQAALAEAERSLEWSTLRVYDFNVEGQNHGILLGTRGWTPD